MHITASVYINDAEDGLLQDYDVRLEKLAPHEPTSQTQATCNCTLVHRSNTLWPPFVHAAARIG